MPLRGGAWFCRPPGGAGAVSICDPGGCAPPDPAGTFCVNKKYPKSHLNLRFKNPFLGFACPANPRRGLKDCAAGSLGRRSLRISNTSSAAPVLVELRLPPFQRETARGAAFGRLRVGAAVGGLTPARGACSNEPASKSAPRRARSAKTAGAIVNHAEIETGVAQSGRQ